MTVELALLGVALIYLICVREAVPVRRKRRKGMKP